MECREAETCADLSLDGELGPVEQAELEQHIERCHECRSMVASRGWYQAHLRERLGVLEATSPAPDSLRLALIHRLDQVRSQESPHHATWRWLVAAAFAVGGIVVATWIEKDTPPLDPEPSVAFHTRNLPPEVVVRRDHRVVEQFVRQTIKHPIRLPSATGAQVRLVGARLSHIDNREAVQLIYDQHGARISLFARPAPGRYSRPSGFRVEGVNGRSFLVGHHRGYSVVSWHEAEKDVLYSLVSDVDEQELIGLASSLDKSALGPADLTVP